MKWKMVVIAFLLTVTSASGHDLYLQSHPFLLTGPGSISTSMYLAEAFPGRAEKWRAGKTSQFVLMGPAGLRKIEHNQETNPTIELSSEGTYTIGWSSSPSYITIDSKHFEEYVTAEGYRGVLEDRKGKGKANAEAREKYTRHLKAFVQVGDKPTDDFSRTIGTRIEMVPKQNPYTLKIGDELSVQVLYEGKPLPSVRVMGTFDTFSTEHDVYAQTVQADAAGIARIKITHPGIWMIRANHMMPLKGDPKAEWESCWSNCSFQVQGKVELQIEGER